MSLLSSPQHIASLIHEYFKINGYNESDVCFEREHNKGSENLNVSQDVRKRLLKHFDSGDRNSFFEVWDSIVKDSSDEANRIEFLCSIHFAVFAVNPNVSCAAKVP